MGVGSWEIYPPHPTGTPPRRGLNWKVGEKNPLLGGAIEPSVLSGWVTWASGIVPQSPRLPVPYLTTTHSPQTSAANP